MPQYMPTGAPAQGAKFAWALPGFDQDAWERSAAGRGVEAMQEMYRRHPDDGMHPEVLERWARAGITKRLFDAGTDSEYAVFAPADLDDSRAYPLVYVSHGGREPINKAENTGFASLVSREQFIAVYPWNGGPSNDDVEQEFPRILAALVRDGYPIDHERIYAVGFSAGSDATGVLACAYPNLLAAVSPSPGGNLFAKGRWYDDPGSYSKNAGVRLPMISVAGTMDGGDRFPLEQPEHVENFSIWMREIVKVAGFEHLSFDESVRLREHSADPSVRAFGFPFHRTFSEELEQVEWRFGDFLDQAGVAVARFVTGVDLPHAQTRSQAPLVWDFLKHFSRDLDTGESRYHPVVVDPIQL